MVPHGTDGEGGVLGDLLFDLQTRLQNRRGPELGRDERNVRRSAEERGVGGKDRGEGWHLLVWWTRNVHGIGFGLLRGKSVGDDGVAVVEAVHVGVELAESAADHGF